jgi:hypothetical protein
MNSNSTIVRCSPAPFPAFLVRDRDSKEYFEELYSVLKRKLAEMKAAPSLTQKDANVLQEILTMLIEAKQLEDLN